MLGLLQDDRTDAPGAQRVRDGEPGRSAADDVHGAIGLFGLVGLVGVVCGSGVGHERERNQTAR